METTIVKAMEGMRLLEGRQTIKLSGRHTAQQLTMMLSIVPAGTGVPLHVHQNEDEIFQLTDGEILVKLNDEDYSLGPGDVIFMPRGIPHGFKAVKDTKMWVTLSPAGIEEMFVELAQLPPGKPDPQRLAEICSRYAVTFI